MSKFSEINDLRKSGQVTEALSAAEQWLSSNQENIWAKRAMAWVRYELLKQYVGENNYEDLSEQVDAIHTLDLPADEDMVFTSIAFTLGKYFFQFANQENNSLEPALQLFEKIREFPFPKPSEGYSFLLKALHKVFKLSDAYPRIIQWWDLQYFQDKDYTEDEFNGRSIMSLAEQILINYAKTLLARKNDPFIDAKEYRATIAEFLPFLEEIILKHPKLTFLPYFQAKLMLATGDEEEATLCILPFARKKRNQYWVWQIMAEIHTDDQEAQIACYCMALSCKSKEDYLVKLRLKLAALLLEKEAFAAAKFEISRSIATREQLGWKIPQNILDWKSSDWYTSAPLPKDNSGFYTQYCAKAEALLYEDYPVLVGVINHVNVDKHMAGFVVNTSISGPIRWDQLDQNPKVGQVVELRLQEKIGKAGTYHRVLTAKVSELPKPEGLVIKFSGLVDRRPGWAFALVDDVFVPPFLVQKYGLDAGCSISGKAILSYNQKREEWGNAAFEILQNKKAPTQASDLSYSTVDQK